MRRITEYLACARPGDWWEFKIPPLLATAYATALFLHVSFQHLWPLLLLLLFALLPGAAYVSLLNDITDLQDDLRCGKSNRMAGRSAAFKVCAVGICLGLGLVAGWFLRSCPLTLGLYGATWVAYTLYSTPPFRLKVRGAWGIAMDASGAHLLPTLWTASLIAEATGHAVPLLFLGTFGIWAGAIGVRGILWHQLRDRENDRRGGVATFAAGRDPKAIRLFVAGVLFPVEVAAFVLVLVQLNLPWAFLILAVYLAMEWWVSRYMGNDLVIVAPTHGAMIILVEYYEFWWPLTLLIALTHESAMAGLLIVLQLVLFPHGPALFFSHVNFLVRCKLIPELRSGLKRILLLIRGGLP
ncbi:MAG TPA: UbiA family prenyltransferase [Candidatus Methylacidiphilales bacterium]